MGEWHVTSADVISQEVGTKDFRIVVDGACDASNSEMIIYWPSLHHVCMPMYLSHREGGNRRRGVRVSYGNNHI